MLKITPPCNLRRKGPLNNGHIRRNSVPRIQQSAGLYVKRQSLETDDRLLPFLCVVKRRSQLAEISKTNRMLKIV